MKKYTIWLTGGGNISGTTSDEDAKELHTVMTNPNHVYSFKDNDGIVSIDGGAVIAVATE